MVMGRGNGRVIVSSCCFGLKREGFNFQSILSFSLLFFVFLVTVWNFSGQIS